MHDDGANVWVSSLHEIKVDVICRLEQRADDGGSLESPLFQPATKFIFSPEGLRKKASTYHRTNHKAPVLLMWGFSSASSNDQFSLSPSFPAQRELNSDRRIHGSQLSPDTPRKMFVYVCAKCPKTGNSVPKSRTPLIGVSRYSPMRHVVQFDPIFPNAHVVPMEPGFFNRPDVTIHPDGWGFNSETSLGH